MTQNRINEFVETLNDEKSIYLLEACQNSINTIEKKIAEANKWVVIVVCLYYLLSVELLESFEIMGIKFKNYIFVEKVFPFIVSCLIYYIIHIAISQYNTKQIYEKVFKSYYSNKHSVDLTELSKFLLPYGIISNLQIHDKGCMIQFLTWLLDLPVLILQLLVVIFLYSALEKIYLEYWDDPMAKLMFVGTIWVLITCVVQFVVFIYKKVTLQLQENTI